MPQSFSCLVVHVIFSTKGRKPAILPDRLPRLFEYVGGTLRAHDSTLIAAGGASDHVHPCPDYPGTCRSLMPVRTIKANSSRWMRETFAQQADFAWQTGFAAFSVSWSQVDHVKTYIDKQESHHAKVSFAQEFRAFLERHGIEYDERIHGS